jgi:hypothetical protein
MLKVYLKNCPSREGANFYQAGFLHAFATSREDYADRLSVISVIFTSAALRA